MPRFVLLYHECPPGYVKRSHWDFMLERDDALWTWELRELPGEWVRALAIDSTGSENNTVAAWQLADHRLAYLDHEGPLAGDRGHVTRVARGEYTLQSETAEHRVVELTGELNGVVTFFKRGQLHRWQMTVGD